MQGKNYLARSCKKQISLQDLARNKFPCKILQLIAFLQGSCKILARNAFSFNQGKHAFVNKTLFVLCFPKKCVCDSSAVIGGLETFPFSPSCKIYRWYNNFSVYSASVIQDNVQKSLFWFCSAE